MNKDSGDGLWTAIGLMSGTSADGVDAALIRTDGQSQIDFLGAITVPYTATLRTDLLQIAQTDVPLADVLRRQAALTLAHETAIRQLLDTLALPPADVDVIGFHGHTIRHLPDEQLTWQLGDPQLLAERLQIAVVSDFRRRDMAAGGQGAPLVPLFHQQLCRSLPKPFVILNLGGVGNLTWLGDAEAIVASDTGPGCGLLDAWAEQHFGVAMDTDGRLSQQGTVNAAAVAAVLQQPFFQRPLPKSADRFDFDCSPLKSLSPHDGLATLCALTAEAVEMAVQRLPSPPRTTYVTGGGSRHPLIMRLLAERLGDVQPIEALQLRWDSMEAECFAWLAVRRMRGLMISLPSTTGCRIATSGGNVTPA